MNLWPSTTFGRTALVIGALLVIAQSAGFVVVNLYLPGPNPSQMAALLDKHISALGAALQVLDAPAREALLAQIPEGGLRLEGEPETPIGKRPRDSFVRELERQLRERLGPGTEILLQTKGKNMLWVRAPVSGGFWIGMPHDTLKAQLPPLLLISLLLITLLTIGGAYLLVRQINRPLSALAKAARKLAHRGGGQTITPAGPDEIRALAQAFNQTALTLDQLERDRALLLAGISHDLRTPLARLDVALELLEGDEELKAGAREDIHNMDSIVGQFTALARTESAEREIISDLNESILNAVTTIERSGLQATLELGKLPPLAFQPLAIHRALINLLENARRYGQPPVRVRSQVNDGTAVVCVIDSGPGVPEAELERLLQPFIRLDKARMSPGTGLGLAIVARIAHAHGGQVVLRNRPKGGLEACLYLPIRTGN